MALHVPTDDEKQTVKMLRWFSLEDIKASSDKIFPEVLADYLPDVLEQREEARGTSPKGHARSHIFNVYGDRKYDLTVNTGSSSAQEIAQDLKRLIEK